VHRAVEGRIASFLKELDANTIDLEESMNFIASAVSKINIEQQALTICITKEGQRIYVWEERMVSEKGESEIR
jgi:hypothetical protein